MRTCTSCGAGGLPDRARYCLECGVALTAGCLSCGEELPPRARFCPACGKPGPEAESDATGPAVIGDAGPPAYTTTSGTTAPTAARRVTSVLFGDLVSFTTLAEGRDQEATRELLSDYFEECRRVITRYGGTIEKFIGDAVMAVWGVPTGHDDDAERAVRAALELTTRIPALGADHDVADLAVRFGITTGLVAVTLNATDQGMVAGDAVNTAARIQAAAVPGQVWVDETTHHLTSSITYTPTGTHHLKGKQHPVPLWAARTVQPASSTRTTPGPGAGGEGAEVEDVLRAPHTGRARELRTVKELFHTTAESHLPALTLVSGEAGSGKTRLAEEFSTYIEGLTEDVRWHTGRCTAYGESTAYDALADALRARLTLDRPLALPESGAATQAEVEEALAQYVTDPAEHAWVAPRLGALLGTAPLGTYTREDLYSAWATVLQRIGNDTEALVLVVEDAHHADDGLVAFLDYLLTSATFACHLVLLARPSLLAEHPRLATHRRTTLVHLDDLPPIEMASLIDHLVDGLPTRLRDALVARAAGTPLYAIETLRGLAARGILEVRRRADPAEAVLGMAAGHEGLDLGTVAPPASLHTLVQARLDALEPTARRVLDLASVLGTSFPAAHLHALTKTLTDLAGTEVDEALTGLRRAQILHRDTDRFSADAGHHQFAQDVTRHVAYSGLSRHDRKATHLAVATILEEATDGAEDAAPVIARHLLRAIDAVPDAGDAVDLSSRATAQLRAAADRAAALGSSAEAADHLAAALELVSETRPEQRAHVETELAEQLYLAGRFDAAVAHATSARDTHDREGEPLAAAQAALHLVRAQRSTRFDAPSLLAETQRRLAEVEALEQDDRTVRLRVDLLRFLAYLFTLPALDDDAAARDAAERCARLADVLGDPRAITDGHSALASARMNRGPFSVVRVLLRSSAELALETHDPLRESQALGNLSSLTASEDCAEAKELAQQALVACRRAGDARTTAMVLCNVVFDCYLTGDWDEAAEVAPALEGDDAVAATVLHLAVARACGTAPPVPLAIATGATDQWLVAMQRLAEALEAEREGRYQDVPDLARDAVRDITLLGSLLEDVAIVLHLAVDLVVAVTPGAGATAVVAALDDMLATTQGPPELAHPVGLRAVRSLLQAHRALLGGGVDPDEGGTDVAETHLRDALDHAEAWKAAPVVARIHAALGTRLVRVSRPDDAERHLEAARAAYSRLGADEWLAELEAALTRDR